MFNFFIFLATKKLCAILALFLLLLILFSVTDREFLTWHSLCLFLGITILKVGFQVVKALIEKREMSKQDKKAGPSMLHALNKLKDTK